MVTVSYSELDTFRQCPLKHKWAYKERWTKPPEEGDPRHTGTAFHHVMEKHYNLLASTRDFNNGVKQIRQDIRNLELDGYDVDTVDLIEWMYDGYLQQYGADEEWQVIDTEYRFEVPLRDQRGYASRYRIKGFIDLIVRNRNTGQLWVVDHKTGRNLPNQLDLEIDDQFGIYVWAMRQLGFNVQGAIHNSIRTQRNMADRAGYTGTYKPQSLDQRFRRTYLNRSDHELVSLALDAYRAAYAAYPPKSKSIPIYSSPDPRQCGWKCDFKEVHLEARKGADPTIALRDFGFIQDFNRQ